VAAALVLSFGTAWGQCDGVRYRYRLFDEIQVDYGVIYGGNVGASGAMEELDMDVYRPAGDDVSDRPVVILAHGGFFLAGSNDGTDVVPLCEDLARMGYVAASISYRLGVDNLFDLETSLQESVLRGVHDAKAAVRFFRRSHAEDGNPWGIDPGRIVLGGSSAGAFIALHVAYIDDLSEVPDIIDLTQPGLGGGLEGFSGNAGYSSEVLSVINISGAMGDANWIAAGDVPVVSTHGTSDGTVPYGTGSISLLGINVAEVDGSWPVHIRAEEMGLDHSLTTFVGAGHVPHMDDATYYDLTRAAAMAFTSRQVCPAYPDIGDYYNVDDPPAVGCTGDVNFDGNVTVADMLGVLSEFGCTEGCAADINADGLVTVTDVLALLGLFGTPCE
jgi:para-nitrobenzyl esterase